MNIYESLKCLFSPKTVPTFVLCEICPRFFIQFLFNILVYVASSLVSQNKILQNANGLEEQVYHLNLLNVYHLNLLNVNFSFFGAGFLC